MSPLFPMARGKHDGELYPLVHKSPNKKQPTQTPVSVLERVECQHPVEQHCRRFYKVLGFLLVIKLGNDVCQFIFDGLVIRVRVAPRAYIVCPELAFELGEKDPVHCLDYRNRQLRGCCRIHGKQQGFHVCLELVLGQTRWVVVHLCGCHVNKICGRRVWDGMFDLVCGKIMSMASFRRVGSWGVNRTGDDDIFSRTASKSCENKSHLFGANILALAILVIFFKRKKREKEKEKK